MESHRRCHLSLFDGIFHTISFFFFFNDTATTEIYTLSLHDALPISQGPACRPGGGRRHARPVPARGEHGQAGGQIDRKSTRLNSSHSQISYAVFCLKKKTTSTPFHSPTGLLLTSTRTTPRTHLSSSL